MPLQPRIYIKSALAYLVAAFLVGGLVLANQGLALDSRIWALLPVFYHLLMVGWATQLIWGVALWMFPALSRERPRGDERVGWVAYGALNAGLLLRAVAEPLHAWGEREWTGAALGERLDRTRPDERHARKAPASLRRLLHVAQHARALKNNVAAGLERSFGSRRKPAIECELQRFHVEVVAHEQPLKSDAAADDLANHGGRAGRRAILVPRFVDDMRRHGRFGGLRETAQSR